MLPRLFRLLRGVRVGGPLSVVRLSSMLEHTVTPGAELTHGMVQLLLLLSFVGAMLASVRQKIISSVRACQCCHGYGIQRWVPAQDAAEAQIACQHQAAHEPGSGKQVYAVQWQWYHWVGGQVDTH